MNSLIVELREWLDGIYGTYMDAVSGFALHHRDLKEREKEHLAAFEKFRSANPGVEFGGATFGYARLLRRDQPVAAFHMHHADYDAVLSRNACGGANAVFMARMTVISIYGFWSDHIRSKLEAEFGFAKDGLKVPVFGDMRILRHCIIHNHCRADSSVRKLEVLRWVNEGDLVSPNRSQIEEMIDRIIDFIGKFSASPESFKAAEPGATDNLDGA